MTDLRNDGMAGQGIHACELPKHADDGLVRVHAAPIKNVTQARAEDPLIEGEDRQRHGGWPG